MSLPDPVTIAAHAPTPAVVFRVVGPTPKLDGLRRISDDGAYGLLITHNVPLAGTERHYIRTSQRKSVTLPSGAVQSLEAAVGLNVSIPPYGWTAAEKAALVTLLIDTLTDPEVTIPSFLNQQS